jgi:hypothetical protein
MKVSKLRAGAYRVALHGHSFTLEKLYGCKDWTLWNDKHQTEVNRAETKSGLLELMRSWSPEYTEREANQDFCTYA